VIFLCLNDSIPVISFHNADAVKWAQEYSGPLFHALFCDAPYHLTTITKRLGKKNSKPIKYGKDGAFSRLSKGFMGNTWDGGDVAFRPETWEAFKGTLHPGAFGMSFSGSRGWHRMAVAIEDAGFIIHPTIFLWCYGSGLPKATKIKGATQFEDHRYGLQALKPAVEPIIVFQKPYKGRPLENIVETGAGALNINGGRIGTDEIQINRWTDSAHPFGGGAGNEYETVKVKGRWPSNFILGDQEAADKLDLQTGMLKSVKFEDHHVIHSESAFNGGKRSNHPQASSYGDQGGASRFFYRVQKDLDEVDPVIYLSKATRQEKEAGIDGLEEQELGHSLYDTCGNCGGYMFQNPDRPSACTCDEPDRQSKKSVNPHPTVKRLDLCRYIASLLLPPVEYSPRRIFVPFAGVASECIGAHLAGWDQIEGVEIDTANGYIDIARQRIDFWTREPVKLDLFTQKAIP